jgi:hypothetical protein
MIIENKTYEEILTEIKANMPSEIMLPKSDPAAKIFEIVAFREMILREGINNAAKSNLLAFADGKNLDYLAEFYGITRQDDEIDDVFRKRIKAKIAAFSTSGTKEHYRFHALVYNDTYDVRYFKLDGSEFWSILSDNSGVKLHDLTLSFGRKSDFATTHSNFENYFGTARNHSIASVTDMIFKLDFGILDEAEPDVNLIKIEYQKQRIYENQKFLGFGLKDFGKPLSFAKASIILSEDSVLEETNTCFNPQEIVESNATFILGLDALSEHIWSLQLKEILERFDNNIVSYSDISDREYYCANPILSRDFVEEIQSDITVVSLNSKALSIVISYKPNTYWNEHRHSSVP